MRKNYIRGNLRKTDYLRALLSDTSPYEIPIIVSNDGFYRNMKECGTASPILKDIIATLITKNTARYTDPYRYRIAKDALTDRELSLVHPASQFDVTEFYERYHALICYYCCPSSFSIRKPARVGSSFFFTSTLASINQFKKSTVDTTNLDKLVRNPASFFSYQGYPRLYKFYNSKDFLRLEKKFEYMWLLDISKCFASIYTHTVSWAIKSIKNSKKNVKKINLGSDFDRLMQCMNSNETNGICIGPEVSRIFAEVILQAIDVKIETLAGEVGLRNGVHYECRRYVDDFILFAHSEEMARIMYRIISECLSEFKLHLNDAKLFEFQRPFLTPKSHVINDAKQRLNWFFDGITEIKDGKHLVPKRVYRADALVRSFISSIKSGCFEQEVGYEMVANYIISSFEKRIQSLMNGFQKVKDVDSSLYPQVVWPLIEIMFFFYTVNPTVASSFEVARCMVNLTRFMRIQFPTLASSLEGQIQLQVLQIIRSIGKPTAGVGSSRVQIELLNILLAIGEFNNKGDFDENFLADQVFKISDSDYFELVSCLFFIGNSGKHSKLRDRAEKRITNLIESTNVLENSQHAHLALDILACPHLSIDYRRSILKRVIGQCGLVQPNNTQIEIQLVQEIEGRPWFVRWRGLDLLNMINKKELCAVY